MKQQQIFNDFYRLLLFGFILVYSVVFTRLAFDQHAGLRTHKADLGQIDQAVWNSSRGRFVEMTDNGFIATRMTDHVEPILALISPVFWVWDDVRALLLLQVVFISVGAWPLYELALLRLDRLLSPQEQRQIWHFEPLRQLTRPLALLLALAYLLAPQLQSAVLTEFHAAPLAAPLILWAFWAVETRRWAQFVVATLLVALVKEETALLAAGLGIWALWQLTKEQRASNHTLPLRQPYFPIALLLLLITLLSLAWFYVTTFVIVPLYAQQVYQGTQSIYFERFGALGNSPVDIVKSFFTQPGMVWRIATEPARLHYLFVLLAPFGFFALLAPEIIFLSLPVLLANLLSAYPAQYYGEFHYSAPLVPYFAASAAYGLGRLWGWVGRRTGQSSPGFQHLPAANASVMALVAFTRNARTTLRPLSVIALSLWLLGWAGITYRQMGRGPLAARYDPTTISVHDQLLGRFVAQLPADAAVTATAAVHPHVSHRRFVYQFPIGLEPPGQANWALLDVTTATDMAPDDVKTRVEQMLAGDWGIVDGADGFLLLRKGMANKTIPAAFYDFARTQQPAIRSAPATGSSPNFSGLHTTDWPRWRETKIISDWQLGPAFNRDTMLLNFMVLTPQNDLRYALTNFLPPALLWYSPAQWQAGETIQVTTLPLYLPRAWGVVLSWPPDLQPSPQLVVSEDHRLALAGVYLRLPDDQLAQAPNELFAAADFGAKLSGMTGVSVAEKSGAFHSATNEPLKLHAWLPQQRLWPGATLNLWLQWQGQAWPDGMQVFVHLRQDGQNKAQTDGLPRYFVAYAVNAVLQSRGFANDWRQLTVPADATVAGEWTVVAGLYQPQTGQRADLVDGNGKVVGNELVIGQVQIGASPAPEQACALIPQTCASQPIR